MQRRRFGREFNVEAVRLIRERGVSVAQAGRDLDVHENILRKCPSGFQKRRWRSSMRFSQIKWTDCHTD
jgi:transposase-like protein